MLQDTIFYILRNTKGLTPSRICGIIFQEQGCSQDDQNLEWTVDADFGSKPKSNRNDVRIDVRAI
jgi:hypothetical protein